MVERCWCEDDLCDLSCVSAAGRHQAPGAAHRPDVQTAGLQLRGVPRLPRVPRHALAAVLRRLLAPLRAARQLEHLPGAGQVALVPAVTFGIISKL